jgi:preprotein translocase SecF subunit
MTALFVAGIGPIQGFSLTILASIVISLATNFFLVRGLCLLLAQAELLPLGALVGHEKKASGPGRRAIDFLAASKTLVFASILTIAAGGFYFKLHGFNLDIDFTAGTALDIDLDRSIDQDTATTIMTGAGIVPATVAIGGKDNEHIAARFDEILKPIELKAIIGAFQAKYGEHVVYEENTADPGVAREFALHAIYAIVAAFLSIALYIGLRFSWSIAFATVVPIIHDVLLVSAIFALFKFEIDVTYIAAILTVIGYSLNDKIVIFGRIRENSRAMDRADGATWRVLINASVHQTLGRSIYTVLTVVMASTCLYLFACEPLEMFALALIIGLVSGAYSSIFFSTLLWIRFGARKAAAERGDGSFALGFASVAILGVIGWMMIPSAGELMSAHASAAASVAGPRVAATAGPLGDLDPFQKIAEDTRTLVAAGKMKEAKERITDLETAWDEAEERLNAASPEDWTSVDKSIDRALALLRSGEPVAKDCDAALGTLIAKMATMSAAGAATASVPNAAVPEVGPLGDLEPFKSIAVDTLKTVGEGDFSRARTRITDLESAWDQAEETMRPKSPDDWTSIDKSIDRALSKVRSGSPDRGECEGALKVLIAKLDTMGVRK